jgi:hypothetical protein
VLGQLGITARQRRAARLEDILPALQQANVGGFVLPFANPRHAHEFRCFEKHPLKDDRVLVAGFIDSLTNFVEHPEVVADRIERVAAVVGDPTRVLAGTDCGFDTSAGWGRVAEDVVWAKLGSLREGARLASSPTPMKSTPTSSARTASSTRLRMTCAACSGLPSGPSVTSPKVSRPNSIG